MLMRFIICKYCIILLEEENSQKKEDKKPPPKKLTVSNLAWFLASLAVLYYTDIINAALFNPKVKLYEIFHSLYV